MITGTPVALNAVGQTGFLSAPITQRNGWEVRIDNVSGYSVQVNCGDWSTYLGPGGSVIHSDTSMPPGAISFSVVSANMVAAPPNPQLLTTWSNLPERVPALTSLSAFARSYSAPNYIAGIDTIPVLQDAGFFSVASPPPGVTLAGVEASIPALYDAGFFSVASPPSGQTISSGNEIIPTLTDSGALSTVVGATTLIGSETISAITDGPASLSSLLVQLNGPSETIPAIQEGLVSLHT